MSQRVGIGYDAHRLVPGLDLVLGGVRVPHDRGLAGHSDADVLAHAVADAVLGASGLGELGEMFPATDERYAGASSIELLRVVADHVARHGFRIVNVDSVIVADRPKLGPYRDEMRANLARAMGIERDRVSVKPKSNEGLGFEGQGEGMSAHAVAIVEAAQQS